LWNLARLKITEKQVERVTERIGQERVDQRDSPVQAFVGLPVVEKFAAAVAHPPDLAVVSMDGGRLQIRDWPSGEAGAGGVATPPPSAEAAAGVARRAVAAEPPEEAGPAGAVPRAKPTIEAGPARSMWRAKPTIEARRVRSMPRAKPTIEARPAESPGVTVPSAAAGPAGAVPGAEPSVEAGPAGSAPVAEPAVEAGPAGSAPVAEPAVEAGPAGSAPVAEPSPAQARSGHWREDKIGLLMTMTSQESAVDPCPEIPETFVNPLRIIKLARGFKKGCPPSGDAVADPPETEGEDSSECPEYTPPTVRVKSMVATRQKAESFGEILAAAAQARGFYGARRKAFLADGAECNWTAQKRWFSDFEPIIDFIHVLSYVFAAAMAGRPFAAGWEVYVRWMSWVWQGRVADVITELGRRQEELGPPAHDESETSPRRVVADALRYLKNNQERMRYDEYRRRGLPITSSHVESTVKQFNRRVKGTEKFWTEEGAEALLQLRADFLSETEPMEKFWQEREAGATGRRCYRRAM
jgi:hypothetical protein